MAPGPVRGRGSVRAPGHSAAVRVGSDRVHREGSQNTMVLTPAKKRRVEPRACQKHRVHLREQGMLRPDGLRSPVRSPSQSPPLSPPPSPSEEAAQGPEQIAQKDGTHVDMLQETVDLTVLSEDSPSSDVSTKKKKSKKSKKKAKKKDEKERSHKRDTQDAEETKAALQEEAARMQEQARLMAQRRADRAARRYALRMESYDKAVLSTTVATQQAETGAPEKQDEENGAFPHEDAAPEQAAPLVDIANGRVVEVEADSATVQPQQVDDDEARLDSATLLSQATAEMRIAAALASAKRDERKGCSRFVNFAAFGTQAEEGKPVGPTTNANDAEGVEAALDSSLARGEKRRFSLKHFPEELPESAELRAEPRVFVAHFVRFIVGAWQRALLAGDAITGVGLTTASAAMFENEAKLKETLRALRPLLLQLKLDQVTDERLNRLAAVIELAVDREYAASNELYMAITMGNKKWHNSLPCVRWQQNHGGSIKRIIHGSTLIDFDKDPVFDSYMRAVRRLIQFAQYIRPPDELSKCA